MWFFFRLNVISCCPTLWGWEHHCMGLYGLELCGKTCWGWRVDGCWPVYGHFGQPVTVQHREIWDCWWGVHLSVRCGPKMHLQKGQKLVKRELYHSYGLVPSLQTLIPPNTSGITYNCCCAPANGLGRIWERAIEMWDNMELGVGQKWIGSMPGRFKTVTNVKGCLQGAKLCTYCISDAHSNKCPNDASHWIGCSSMRTASN